jgi:septum formation protein
MSHLSPAHLILASGSAVRATLLRQAGLVFEIQNSRVDEDVIKESFTVSNNTDIDALTLELAAAKANAVSALHPNALVIGADQILSCENHRYDKPRDMDEARANLMKFRGRPHRLHSGVVIAQAGKIIWQHSDHADLTMRDFSDAFLDNYLAEVGPKVMASVGCYQLEGLGVQLFDKIEGDYFTILGLPLLPLLEVLRGHHVVLS